VPSLALALAAIQPVLEPLAAAQAAADAAPGQPAGLKSAAAADVPPPLLQQRHAIFQSRRCWWQPRRPQTLSLQTVRSGRQPLWQTYLKRRSQQRPIAPGGPSADCIPQAALAAIPRQPPPSQETYSQLARKQQQQQPSGSSLQGSWGSGRQRFDTPYVAAEVSTATKCQVPSR
jgi:hypothetical protein